MTLGRARFGCARNDALNWTVMGEPNRPRPRVRVEPSILERGQPHVLGDPWNIGRTIEETFELARHQFSIGQPLLPIGQLLIYALDRHVVREAAFNRGVLRGPRRVVVQGVPRPSMPGRARQRQGA